MFFQSKKIKKIWYLTVLLWLISIVFGALFCFIRPTLAQTAASSNSGSGNQAVLPTLGIKIPGLIFSSNIETCVCSDATKTLADCPKLQTNCTLSIPWLGQYINAFYLWSLRAIAVLAIFMLVLSGLQWITAAGNPTTVSAAKSRMGAAIIGLVLILSTNLILYLINPQLTILKPIQIGAIKQLSFKNDDAEIGAKIGNYAMSTETCQSLSGQCHVISIQANGETVPGCSANQVTEVFKLAFDTWNHAGAAVSFKVDNSAPLKFAYGDDLCYRDCASDCGGDPDCINDCNDKYHNDDGGDNTVACAHVGVEAGEILIDTDNTNGCEDLQDTITHELGHTLGIVYLPGDAGYSSSDIYHSFAGGAKAMNVLGRSSVLNSWDRIPLCRRFGPLTNDSCPPDPQHKY